MAREFIRPDVPARLLDELVPPNLRLLINPDWNDLLSALRNLQTRTRKNLITEVQLRSLFDMTLKPGFFSAAQITATQAPFRYQYDFPSSQAAACRLGPGLIGFVLRRCLTPPGALVDSPIYSGGPTQAGFDPQEWLNSVCMTFWTRLTDDEINALEREAIGYAMVAAARAREEQRIRREAVRIHRAEAEARNRELVRMVDELARMQLNTLFKGVEPEYTTNVSELCRSIAETLRADQKDGISWQDFKKKWASVAERHKNDILPIVEDGWVSAEALSRLEGPKKFGLSFGLWNGSQRLFNAPQIVFRVEAKELLQKTAKADHASCEVVAIVLKANRARSGFHPNTEWTVGWLRVHVDDDNKVVFVDEIQSDTMELVRQMSETKPGAAKLVAKELRPWNLHGFASVSRWARAIGYRVGLPSKESAACKPGMTQSNRKWNEYYEPVIRQFALEKQSVALYPAPIMLSPADTDMKSKE